MKIFEIITLNRNLLLLGHTVIYRTRAADHPTAHVSRSPSSDLLCTLVLLILLHTLLLFLYLQERGRGNGGKNTASRLSESLIKQQKAHPWVWVCVSWCKSSCALCPFFVHSADVTTFTFTVEGADVGEELGCVTVCVHVLPCFSSWNVSTFWNVRTFFFLGYLGWYLLD